MSKIKFLLALCLLVPAYAKAETWNCIFNDISGEKVPIIYTEVRGQYYVDLGEAEAAVVKTFEDDKFLHLVLSVQADMLAVVIEKETQIAKSIFLSMATSFDQSLADGFCYNY